VETSAGPAAVLCRGRHCYSIFAVLSVASSTTACAAALRWPEGLALAEEPSFDDSGGAEVDIEVLTQDITRLFRKCEGRLQQFGAGTSSSEADEKVPAWRALPPWTACS